VIVAIISALLVSTMISTKWKTVESGEPIQTTVADLVNCYWQNICCLWDCIYCASCGNNRRGIFSEETLIIMHVGLTHFLVVSSLLFGLGLFAVVTRKNAIMILMGIELILIRRILILSLLPNTALWTWRAGNFDFCYNPCSGWSRYCSGYNIEYLQ